MCLICCLAPAAPLAPNHVCEETKEAAKEHIKRVARQPIIKFELRRSKFEGSAMESSSVAGCTNSQHSHDDGGDLDVLQEAKGQE